MKTAAIQVACLLTLSTVAQATEFHVATSGNDANPGTQAAPFRTIQHAADLAQPGDVITVHQGIYRERINPPRGGESDARRIVYQAAPGEKVEIRGSEVVKNWVQVSGRRLENDPAQCLLRAASIPTAISSTATGSIPKAGRITPARSTSMASGWPRRPGWMTS